MAARALPRILQIRQVEEDHLKARLEAALAKLARLVDSEKATLERERRGRALLLEAIHSDQLQDRHAEMLEIGLAQKLRRATSLKIEEAREAVRQVRAQYMAKRAERRQLETLIEAKRAREAHKASRRQQETVDGQYTSRRFRVSTAKKPLTTSLDGTHGGDKPEASS